MSSLSSLNYTDIIESCYSEDGKNLTKVNDTSPHLRISAKCELIQDKCFYQLNSLISFSFEDNPNLTIIGKESFYFCTKLSIINLSICNKLTKISNSAFYNCEEVTEILLPKGLIEINVAAFRYNIKLDHITIPASVEKIESQAFDTCFELTYVIFEEGSNLTSLERTAFYYTNISSFQIPEKVAYVHGWVFSN
ncbi:regulation of response to stimulus, partial [Trichomonas vaginalis G3]|uniref:regulation of response to stimulus n=1 Tax=Trichomonas vaginalis (strain ATCC PRA-98 / G3) TaxID=412133 RepID=UPI0021E58FAD